jgi:formyltetrahydrofolate hydrolase
MVSLIDVIITNKDIIGELATLMDLGYSDHKAQILQQNVKTIVRKFKKIKSRQYLKERTEESWQEVFQTSKVNSTVQVFMDIFGYYFSTEFPNKLINLHKTYYSKWITEGIKIYCKRMHFEIQQRGNLIFQEKHRLM